MSRTVDQWLITAPAEVFSVLLDVTKERSAQDEKWGVQNHPDGTGPGNLIHGHDVIKYRDQVRANCDREHAAGRGTYAQILLEEVAEAFAESEPANIRAELVQVAAVAIQWIEAIDRRPEVTA